MDLIFTSGAGGANDQLPGSIPDAQKNAAPMPQQYQPQPAFQPLPPGTLPQPEGNPPPYAQADLYGNGGAGQSYPAQSMPVYAIPVGQPIQQQQPHMFNGPPQPMAPIYGYPAPAQGQPISGQSYPYGQQAATAAWGQPHVYNGQYNNGVPSVPVQMGYVQPQQQQGTPGGAYTTNGTYTTNGGAAMPYAGGTPGAQYSTQTVAIPVRINPNIAQIGNGAWTDGLCECYHSFEICGMVWCISPYRWAKTIERVGFMAFWPALICYGIPWLIWTICLIISIATSNGVAQVFFWLSLIVMAYVGCQYRTRLRNKFNIAGGSCEDFCLHCFCRCCVLGQEARHIDRWAGILAPAP